MPGRAAPVRGGGPPSRQSSQGRGRGRGRGNRPQQQPPGKFKGNCTDLQGQIFDCSDYKQADTFVNTLKRISKYVGAHYKHGGDIRSTIVYEVKITIPIPMAPTIVDTQAVTPNEQVARMIFKDKPEAYIKRKGMLDDNIQKAYSLVI
jgi:hypothetical protein